MSKDSVKATEKLSFADLARATPAGRDRYVDFLRAFSICVVVLGHWLIAVIFWQNGEIRGENALHTVPGLWIATWILQVMPIFFFVGGFSNLVTFDSVTRKGGGYIDFVLGRVRRLMRPTALMLGIWIPLTVAVDLFTPLSDPVLDGATGLLTRPLWFVGIYLIVIALAPSMIRVHRRLGVRALAVMALGAAVVDVAAIGFNLRLVGFLNYPFVWLFVHQLGFFYADGSLLKFSRKAFAGMAAAGLLALGILTASGIYSPSMVGLVNERSNTNPPTIVLVALTLWQLGLVMLLRDPLSRWLSKQRPWTVVIGLNAVIMTLFLWHQTALLLGVAIMYPLGFPQAEAGSGLWWLFRPVWLAGLSIVLAVLVLLLGRFERGIGRREKAQRQEGFRGFADRSQNTAAVAGVVFVVIGILGFAVGGFEGFAAPRGRTLVIFQVNPLQNVLHLLAGGFLLSRAAASSNEARKAATAGAVILGLAGILGLMLLRGTGEMNILAANPAVHWLHIAAAIALAYAVVSPSASRTPAHPGPAHSA